MRESISPNASYHRMNLGASAAAVFSMNAKSSVKFSAQDDDHDADPDAQWSEGVREGEVSPSVFGHVLDVHQLESQSAYAIEDSVEV
jgi:hypothetical protein